MSALVELPEENETRPGRRISAADARALLEHIKREFDRKPFVPHRVFRQGDAQTIGAHFWPRRIPRRDQNAEERRLFEDETGPRELARVRRQAARPEHR